MSSQFSEGLTRTFRASGAIPQYSIVKLDGSGLLTLAGASDAAAIGVTQREAFAANDAIAVKGFSQGYSQVMRAAAAFAKAAVVYQAANGEIDDSGTIVRGVALEAAAAADDWVEVAHQ